MTKQYKVGDEVLVKATVEQVDASGQVIECVWVPTTAGENDATHMGDGEFAYPPMEHVIDPSAPKTVKKIDGNIWLPDPVKGTIPWCPGAVASMGGSCFGIKRGGENYLLYVLTRIDKGNNQIEWVTWEYNQQTDSLFTGHYFEVGSEYPTEAHAYAAALEDFNLRNWG
jgi:hypothetical protein